MSYGVDLPRIHQYGETTILNGCERYILELLSTKPPAS